MDISYVRFGNYAIGNPNVSPRRNEEKKENSGFETQNNNTKSEYDPQSVLEAMTMSSVSNMPVVNHASKANLNGADSIDVAKYNTDEDMARIEAMMAEFDNGVSIAADIIENEFPGLLSDEDKLALAAQTVALG